MATEIKMPDLGTTVETVVLLKWHIAETGCRRRYRNSGWYCNRLYWRARRKRS